MPIYQFRNPSEALPQRFELQMSGIRTMAVGVTGALTSSFAIIQGSTAVSPPLGLAVGIVVATIGLIKALLAEKASADDLDALVGTLESMSTLPGLSIYAVSAVSGASAAEAKFNASWATLSTKWQEMAEGSAEEVASGLPQLMAETRDAIRAFQAMAPQLSVPQRHEMGGRHQNGAMESARLDALSREMYNAATSRIYEQSNYRFDSPGQGDGLKQSQ